MNNNKYNVNEKILYLNNKMNIDNIMTKYEKYPDFNLDVNIVHNIMNGIHNNLDLENKWVNYLLGDYYQSYYEYNPDKSKEYFEKSLKLGNKEAYYKLLSIEAIDFTYKNSYEIFLTLIKANDIRGLKIILNHLNLDPNFGEIESDASKFIGLYILKSNYDLDLNMLNIFRPYFNNLYEFLKLKHKQTSEVLSIFKYHHNHNENKFSIFLYDKYVKDNQHVSKGYITDFKFIVNDKEYFVHSMVLHSEYFLNLIDNENFGHEMEITLDCSEETIIQFIRFLYTDDIDKDLDNEIYDELFEISDYFNYDDLKVLSNYYKHI